MSVLNIGEGISGSRSDAPNQFGRMAMIFSNEYVRPIIEGVMPNGYDVSKFSGRYESIEGDRTLNAPTLDRYSFKRGSSSEGYCCGK